MEPFRLGLGSFRCSFRSRDAKKVPSSGNAETAAKTAMVLNTSPAFSGVRSPISSNGRVKAISDPMIEKAMR